MNRNNIILYVLIFLSTFLFLETLQKDKSADPVLSSGSIGIETQKDSYGIGKDVKVQFLNNTENVITIESRCPAPYVDVEKYTGEAFVPVENITDRNCDKAEDLVLEPHKKETVSLLEYSYELFSEVGRYKISLTTILEGEEKTFSTPEFEVHKPSFITEAWRTVLYQPTLNLLVGLLVYMPNHNLALAIIVLTLIIRTILLVPSQRAIVAQRKMQEVQPKIEELKKKYANDQTRLAQETMLLWKTHKVHPLSSCLPVLIQMPILIALYTTIQGGLSPDKAVFIYPFMPEFSLNDIDSNLFGFDLFERSLLVFPLIVGALQFLQMQLMMIKNKKSTSKLPSEMEMTNKMMKYIMPIMIAVITAQTPAAVGLYWGTSTIYGILQQLVVNKGGKNSPTQKKDEEVTVRVVNKRSHHS